VLETIAEGKAILVRYSVLNFCRIWSPTQKVNYLIATFGIAFYQSNLSKISAYGRQAKNKNDLAWTVVILDPLVGTGRHCSPQFCDHCASF
jgi:hypothetical protein